MVAQASSIPPGISSVRLRDVQPGDDRDKAEQGSAGERVKPRHDFLDIYLDILC
jgi:hypothetical protein